MTVLEPEKVTVTISSSAGEDAPLTVEDAMLQILDFFSLMEAAGGEEGQAISWQLVEISINSPLRATAQAVPRFSGVEAAPIARREKAKLANSMRQLVRAKQAPDWMSGDTLKRAKSLLARNSQGIGRTKVVFNDENPAVDITTEDAAAALTSIDNDARARITERKNKFRTELGTVEGTVQSTTMYYTHPAVVIKDRNTGELVVCVASQSAISQGTQHTWAETWANKRVLVSGELHYNADDIVYRVASADFEIVDGASIKLHDIYDPKFTNGLSPKQYIQQLWSGDE